jgi:hypothetical protein
MEIFRQAIQWSMLASMWRTLLLSFYVAMAAVSLGQSPHSPATSKQASDTGKNGTIVVLVTLDDVNKTPPRDIYVEAHSFNVNWVSEKSFVLKMVKAGRYEAALPPGVYDVFVSEPSSTPRCRRVLVTAGYTGYWSLMLEHDDVYLAK